VIRISEKLADDIMSNNDNTVAIEDTVHMKNTGADGIMVFEPGFLKVAVGDTVHFEPTDAGHNSESIKGLIPAGATAWKGDFGKKVTVKIDKEGVYVYECLPHSMLAMVGVIVAGKPTNLAEVKKNAAPISAKFSMNKERLNMYLAKAK
jgi:pseudoazurin